jgi:hypothetical protein
MFSSALYRLRFPASNLFLVCLSLALTSAMSAGQNRLAQAPTFSLGTGTNAVSVTADFHGDHRADILAIVNHNANLLTADAGGGYGPPKTVVVLPSTVTGAYIVTGDFNGDGKQDFALLTAPSNTISVYLGNGDGTFQSPKTTTGPSGELAALTAAYINHDSTLT